MEIAGQSGLLMNFEPFVNAVVAGQFLDLHPVTVQRMARTGALPGHPLCGDSCCRNLLLGSNPDSVNRNRPRCSNFGSSLPMRCSLKSA
jgi:hypothetical protein